MTSAVAKSYSSSGLAFINEEPHSEERRQSADESNSSSSPLDPLFSPRKNCLTVQGVATLRRPDLPLSTSECSDASESGISSRKRDSSITPELAPRSILRPPRLMTAPKQLSFDIPPSPVPSPKSSCVSSSGSYHMFERPARVLRGRKDPARYRLSTLQQRSNSESVFAITPPPSECCRRVSVAHIPYRDQALLRKILGPQGLSWIGSDKGVQWTKFGLLPSMGHLYPLHFRRDRVAKVRLHSLFE